MDIASLVLSLMALGVAIGAAVYTRRQATEATRSNDLTEAAHQRALADKEAQRVANRVVWRVDPAGSGLVLRNTGTETAHDVEAWTTAAPFASGPLVDDESDPRGARLVVPSVSSGSSIKFAVMPQSQWTGSGNELLVTWRGQAEPVAVALPN